MEDYQTRKDVDELYKLLGIKDGEISELVTYAELNKIWERFGFDKPNNDKFNFAVITKIEDDIEYQEFWILSNAYYDYDDGYFHKIDLHNTSFGIQIQGKGAYYGEASLGYYDNSGLNVWRNPPIENLDWATDEQKRCLVEDGIIGEYVGGVIQTFAVSCGWNNAFMFDSYGGMTIGGTGFEIDGNGIFPYTRVANCLYTNPSDNKEYGYIALLHNAYNSTRFGWDCDNNRTYSWMMGIHAPVDTNLGGNNLDLSQADFRVMYNDTPFNQSNIHELDITRWKTILKVDGTSIQSMVDGVLSTLGSGDGGGTQISTIDSIIDGNMNAITSNAVHDGLTNKANSVHTHYSDDIRITGTQYQITPLLKTANNVLNEYSHFTHVFSLSVINGSTKSQIYSSSDKVYYYDMGVLDYNTYLTDGSIIAMRVASTTQATINEIILEYTLNNQKTTMIYPIYENGEEYTSTLEYGDYILCLHDPHENAFRLISKC